MKSYKDIKSKYLKNKVKGLSWEKSNYIDDLMTLEKWILGEISGWATAMMVHGLKGKYEIDYLEILRELKPERFEELIKKNKMLEKSLKVLKIFLEKVEGLYQFQKGF